MKTGKFPQQIDPFTSVPDEGDCYGPMLLSMLEYTALTTGIAVRAETSTILWSHLTSSSDGVQPNVDSGVKVQSDNADVVFTFTQRLGSAVYQLDAANGTFTGKSYSLFVTLLVIRIIVSWTPVRMQIASLPWLLSSLAVIFICNLKNLKNKIPKTKRSQGSKHNAWI